jgi:phage terminase Nu1 subunit (DNA packaging protein)
LHRQFFANKLAAMITIEATEKEFHVTISREAVDERAFATFIAWLRDESAAHALARRREAAPSLAEIAASSRMTEAQADALADEIKDKWWAENQRRFLPPEELSA